MTRAAARRNARCPVDVAVIPAVPASNLNDLFGGRGHHHLRRVVPMIRGGLGDEAATAAREIAEIGSGIGRGGIHRDRDRVKEEAVEAAGMIFVEDIAVLGAGMGTSHEDGKKSEENREEDVGRSPHGEDQDRDQGRPKNNTPKRRRSLSRGRGQGKGGRRRHDLPLPTQRREKRRAREKTIENHDHRR